MCYGKFDPELRQEHFEVWMQESVRGMFKTDWAHPARCFLSLSGLLQNASRRMLKVRIHPLPKWVFYAKFRLFEHDSQKGMSRKTNIRYHQQIFTEYWVSVMYSVGAFKAGGRCDSPSLKLVFFSFISSFRCTK